MTAVVEASSMISGAVVVAFSGLARWLSRQAVRVGGKFVSDTQPVGARRCMLEAISARRVFSSPRRGRRGRRRLSEAVSKDRVEAVD